MAIKNYRALTKGYVDGRVIEPGEVFATEFKEVKREAPVERDGRKAPGAIVRDKKGDPVMVPAKAHPSWVEELDARKGKLEKMVADAQDENHIEDANLEELSRPALEAMAAERHIQFTSKTSDEDLKTAIRAAADPTR